MSMTADVYLANSCSRVYSRLVERAVLDPEVANLVESRRDAEMIIYIRPEGDDPDATDRLRDFRPRDLLRTFVYAQTDGPVPWAPGVYASMSARRAPSGMAGGFYVVDHHREGGLDVEAARAIDPDLLWSFTGTVENHPVRASLQKIRDERGLVENTQAWNDRVRWGWDSEHRDEGRRAFARFTTTLGRSSFAVCPRGRGAATIRLFEALQAGRCPVILSDDWIEPPFVDWARCSIRLPERDVGDLPRILREREHEAEALGREARLTWERLYAPERQLQTLISTCIAIRDESPNRAKVLARGLLNPEVVRRSLRGAKASVLRRSGTGGA